MQTELDRISNQNHLQLFKALIPHLPAQYRKQFSVMIKIMEVQNVIRFYNSPRDEGCAGSVSSASGVGRSCGSSDDPSEQLSPDLLDVLSDVRCYCEGEEQQMIDQTLQMMSMVELFSIMAQDGEAPGSGSCSPEEPPPGDESRNFGAPAPEANGYGPGDSPYESEDQASRKGDIFYE